MEFEIDEAFLTDIIIHKEWGMFDDKDTLTDEELLKVLEGKDRCSMTSSDDHPEFKKLRFHLEDNGFIKVQRGWWNGDEVIKPFTLNGKRFEIGDQFPSAGPMKWTLTH
jgi:hypothetical protein